MSVRTSFVAVGVPAVLCLAACQSLQDGQSLQVTAAEPVRHSVSRPDALFAIGRYQQGQMRYEAAVDAYTRLLAEYPDHADARNALGVVLAGQGRYDAAIAELEKAVANAPNSATMRNNLGYAYLLRGSADTAIETLTIAAQLDPANPRVRDNLAMARARDGQRRPEMASIERKSEVKSADTVAPDGVQLVALAANVFALRLPIRMPAKTLPTTVEPVAQNTEQAPVPQTEASAGGVVAKARRLEVSNGNGVSGLARDLSGHLEGTGYASVRKTNEMPYRMSATEIQYRPGFEPQARDLQTTLRSGIPLVASTKLRADVQVRLLLGKDTKSVSELVAQATPGQPEIRLAAALH